MHGPAALISWGNPHLVSPILICSNQLGWGGGGLEHISIIKNMSWHRVINRPAAYTGLYLKV